MQYRNTAASVSKATTRGVWALLAVLWLNMAVLPCAMAIEAADHDCPHCPPAAEHEMAGHHGHGRDQDGTDLRPQQSCATMQAKCCDLAVAAVDARTERNQVPDAADAGLFVVADVTDLSPLPAAQHITAADPPDPPGSFPPRHILFCVYLD